MGNALILNLPGGRLTIGPAEPSAPTLNLRIEGASGIFANTTVPLSREQVGEVERFLGLWLDPPLPPSDTVAEQRLLGAIIRRPGLFEVLADDYTDEIFADPVHRAVWAAMDRLHHERGRFTLDELRLALSTGGVIDEVGGPAYLKQLVTAAPASACDAVDIAAALNRMWERRQPVKGV